MIDYNNKIFRSISNSANGEVSTQTKFYYKQTNNIVTAEYSGGSIVRGSLVGIVDENGNIDLRYGHINSKGELMTGICYSTPELLPNGKIRLHEKWQWTSGDMSEGTSIIEEE